MHENTILSDLGSLHSLLNVFARLIIYLRPFNFALAKLTKKIAQTWRNFNSANGS